MILELAEIMPAARKLHDSRQRDDGLTIYTDAVTGDLFKKGYARMCWYMARSHERLNKNPESRRKNGEHRMRVAVRNEQPIHPISLPDSL